VAQNKEKKMARHQSALRQHRRSLRRNDINRKSKSMLRTQVKKLREAIQEKNKDAAEKLLPSTMSLIDKSVKKGAIHENKGRRYKSRLSRQVELVNPSPSK
jgi:small subunit ribosomal protein S20